MNLRSVIPLAVVLPVAGCALGWVIGSAVFADSQVAWRALGGPASPPASFVHASTQIIVRSRDGVLYSRHLGGPDTWLPISEDEANALPDDSFDQCPQVSPPNLEGVVAQAEACHGYGDIILTTRYAIDQGGRVWWWRGHSYRKWEYAVWGALGSFALAVLLVVGALLFALLQRLRRRPNTAVH